MNRLALTHKYFGTDSLSRPAHSPVRVAFIDVARAIAIILMLYAHALEMSKTTSSAFPESTFTQWQFIYGFHMPLFYVISGLVFRQKSKTKIVEGSLNLIFIAFAIHFFVWAAALLVGLPHHRPNGQDLGNLIRPFAKGGDFATVVVWFLVSLAFVQVLFNVWLLTSASKRIMLAVGLAVIFLASQAKHINTWQISTVPEGFALFALGYWITKQKIAERFNRNAPAITGALFGFAIAMVASKLNHGCTFHPNQSCSNFSSGFGVFMAHGELGFIPLFVLSATAGSLAVILLADVIARSIPALSNQLSSIGSKSLDLLIVNGIVLVFVQKPLGHYVSHELSPVAQMAVAAGLTAVQILLLPVWQLFTLRLASMTKRWAGAVASRLEPKSSAT